MHQCCRHHPSVNSAGAENRRAGMCPLPTGFGLRRNCGSVRARPSQTRRMARRTASSPREERLWPLPTTCRRLSGNGVSGKAAWGWWVMRDSNSRHLRCKRSALPTELITLGRVFTSGPRTVQGDSSGTTLSKASGNDTPGASTRNPPTSAESAGSFPAGSCRDCFIAEGRAPVAAADNLSTSFRERGFRQGRVGMVGDERLELPTSSV